MRAGSFGTRFQKSTELDPYSPCGRGPSHPIAYPLPYPAHVPIYCLAASLVGRAKKFSYSGKIHRSPPHAPAKQNRHARAVLLRLRSCLFPNDAAGQACRLRGSSWHTVHNPPRPGRAVFLLLCLAGSPGGYSLPASHPTPARNPCGYLLGAKIYPHPI